MEVKEKNIESSEDDILDKNESDLFDIISIDEHAPKKVKDANDVYEKLEPNQKEAVTTLVRYQFSGPLPHPSILKGYDDIEKGFADRIVKMAEKDQDAQIKNNEKVLKLQGRDVLIGSIFAFITVISILVAGVILLLNDKDTAGLGTLLSGGAMLVGLFIHSKSGKEGNK